MPLMPDAKAWTYSGDPEGSDLDQVRHWMQDTDPHVRLLSDVEIEFQIKTWVPRYDSLIYAAAKCAELVSVKFAGVMTVSADGVSVNVGDLSNKYSDAARRLYQMYKDGQVGGEIDIRNLLWDSRPDYGIAPLVFGVGLHDNREAGQQNYGGESINPWTQAEEIARGY